MNIFERINKRGIASGKLVWQIIGALFEWRPRALAGFILLVIPISAGLTFVLSPGNYVPGLYFLGLNLVVWMVIKVCNTLSGLFSLSRKEAGITWCQVSILAAIGLWIIGFILIFNIQNNGRMATVLGVVGSVAGWIFQDKLKGVMAFIHLRMHNMLNIDDWIQVPKYNVDGEVKAVTLTTVTVYNWDTTTSTIPISALHDDHFINLQNMAAGKTYGRRVMKTFILDTSYFAPINAEEAELLMSDSFNAVHEIRKYLPREEVKEGALNAYLYRIYLYHWLMSHPHISQMPHLIVRWMEQDGNGMPLQVYAFLLDSEYCSFEWQQSQLMEHVMESLQWFGLRLYQAPSAVDLRNFNQSLDQ